MSNITLGDLLIIDYRLLHLSDSVFIHRDGRDSCSARKAVLASKLISHVCWLLSIVHKAFHVIIVALHLIPEECMRLVYTIAGLLSEGVSMVPGHPPFRHPLAYIQSGVLVGLQLLSICVVQWNKNDSPLTRLIFLLIAYIVGPIRTYVAKQS